MNSLKRSIAAAIPLLVALVATLALVSFASCAVVKSAVKTADDVAAQLLCAQTKSELTGISVEEARDTYCSTRDTWRPWLDAVLKARRAGAALATGTTPPTEGPGCPPGAPAAVDPAPAPSGAQSSPAGGSGAR